MTARTAAQAADTLCALGLDPAERPAKHALFELALTRFDGLGTGRPEHLFWVPGRLEVFGKHTDYAGGRTLVAAVPRGFAVAVGHRADDTIHVVDAARDQSVVLSSSGATEPATAMTGWRRYVETVVRRLSRNFPGAAVSANIVQASDLPRASGMSSSSALMVGVAAALGRVADLGSRPEWRANVNGPLDAAAYYACIENGQTFGTLAGDAGVGTHGGSEDHAALITGQAGRLSAFAFVPMRQIDSVAVPDEWRFVLTPSGVAADKTGGAMGPYNHLSRAADVLLRLWNETQPPATSLAVALASSSDAVSRLRAVASRQSLEGWPPGVLTTRLEHFIREDARIPLAVAAFRAVDAAALGRLSAESQRDAEVLLCNQVPDTVALVAAARELDAFAAASFGAGFGGSVWALVPRHAATRFAAAWRSGAFVASPSPPLSEL